MSVDSSQEVLGDDQPLYVLLIGMGAELDALENNLEREPAVQAVELVVSEKAEATFPGKNGRIVYAGWNRGEDFEIYTINPDGSGKTQLTNNSTDDVDPAYSSDGKKIVYVGQDGPKGDLEIYTINARGGDKFQVTHNDADEEWPSYSPSGKRIAYTDLALNEPGPNIYSIKAGGGARA